MPCCTSYTVSMPSAARKGGRPCVKDAVVIVLAAKAVQAWAAKAAATVAVEASAEVVEASAEAADSKT